MQGVGKVVSYTNADRILPRELLDAIQQYADGVYLYIPRKAEPETGLGRGHGLPQGAARPEQGAVRETSRRRSVHKLAEEYYLSAKTIYKILASMRQA